MLDKNIEVSMVGLEIKELYLNEFIEWDLNKNVVKKNPLSQAKQIFALEKNRLLRLEDFKKCKMLGQGGFGKVLLCQNTVDNCYFAMKVLNKKKIVETGQVENTKSETKLMAFLDHPFLVSLNCAFMDNHKIYLIMELMKGGELYTHLINKRRFSEEEVRFFVACIGLAFGHLHANHYVYRDLKLENILLDCKGYLKLADFGLSKQLKKEEKTKTLCGTIFYLAPEVITNSGHSFPIDWWSLGIVTYELLNGHPPFYTRSNNFRILRRIIAKGKLIFEEKLNLSENAKDFISRLLVKDPDQRMGSKGDLLEIMEHPWMAGIDWTYLFEKKVEPVFKPPIDEENWLNNFDPEVTKQNIHRDSEMYEADTSDSDKEINKYFEDFNYNTFMKEE